MESQFVPYTAVQILNGSRILVLAPHPDDEIFGCGGSLAAHTVAGACIYVCILTDGDFLSRQDEQDVIKYGEERKTESIRAAQILGYGAPEFWGLKDRSLVYCESLILSILRELQERQPDLVYCPSFYEIHPDHRAACMATIEAVRRYHANIQVALYEVGVPIPRPNCLLDISRFQELKSRLIHCFSSQLSQNNYSKTVLALNSFRTYTLEAGIDSAEAYEVISSEQIKNELFSILRPIYYADKAKGADCIGCIDVPLVTVIIRSIHRPNLLRQAIDSIQFQTYKSIEIILVSAGSGPHPEINSGGSFPVRLIEGQSEPLHRSKAGNLGLDQASGKYIIFLDDDDTIMPDHIAKLVSCLQVHPKSILAYTGIGFINDCGDVLPGGYVDCFRQSTLISCNRMPIHAALFSRYAIEAGCRLDESLDLLEDWDFWLQLASLGQFEFVPGVSGYYRQHESSGVRSDLIKSRQAYEAIFAKWRSRWPLEMLREGMEYLSIQGNMKSKLEQELSSLNSSHAELERSHAELERSLSELTSAINSLKRDKEHISKKLYWYRQFLPSMLDLLRRNRRLNKQIAAINSRILFHFGGQPRKSRSKLN